MKTQFKMTSPFYVRKLYITDIEIKETKTMDKASEKRLAGMEKWLLSMEEKSKKVHLPFSWQKEEFDESRG